MKKRMRSGWRRGMLFLLIASSWWVAMRWVIPVAAASYRAEASLVLHQVFTYGETPPQDSFAYTLQSEAGAPLPEGATGDIYRFQVTGTDTATIGPITYFRPGIYRYQVQQVIEAREGYTYDDARYTVVVEVKNTADGGLSATVDMPVNRDGFKVERMTFEHTYHDETSSRVPSGGVPSDGKEPQWLTGTLDDSPHTGDASLDVWWALAMGAALSLGGIAVTKRDEGHERHEPQE